MTVSKKDPKKNSLKLGILIYGRGLDGIKPTTVLRNMVGFANQVESFGYHRIWVTEHHEPNVGWSCPEPLMTVIAQSTSKIKVGVGGIQLLAYNELQIASDFKTIANLFPNRIALGIGSGLIGHNHIGFAKKYPLTKADASKIFQKKAENLVKLLKGFKFTRGDLKGCCVYPQSNESPEVWILGAGCSSLKIAEELCVNYNHGLTLDNVAATSSQIQTNVRNFAKNTRSQQKCITVTVICDETEKKAQQAFRRFQKITKIYGPLPALTLIGSVKKCVESLKDIQRQYQTDEIAIRTTVAEPNELIARFEMLSECMGLKK